jgi:putative transposase
MPFRHAAHSVYDCQYHLVWTPKRRRPVLLGLVGKRLTALFIEIGESYDIDILELHVAPDHVHIYCSFPPRLSISQAVTRLKSLSARTLFREFPDLRRRMISGELWEGGYFARTAGDSLTGDIIRRYIRNHRDEQPAEEPDDPQLDLFQ